MFLLPGIGDHYVGMGDGLYQGCETFRAEVDRCAEILEPLLGVDIRQVIYPASQSWKQTTQAKGIDLKRMLGHAADGPPDPDTLRLSATLYSQPALFTIEYAMARQWAALGVTPGAIIGHSMGEYVAACLSGVLSLPDALRLIAVRAKLVNELPQAPMLAVMLSEEELLPQLPADLSISLINGPAHCVVAGPPDSIAAFERTLTEKGVIARRVQNGHAFHTRLMEPVASAFEEEVRKVSLSAPQIPYISNVTGTWITAADAIDPTYWVRHLTRTARFSEALHEMWQLPDPVMLECGPGRTLTILANQHLSAKGRCAGRSARSASATRTRATSRCCSRRPAERGLPAPPYAGRGCRGTTSVSHRLPARFGARRRPQTRARSRRRRMTLESANASRSCWRSGAGRWDVRTSA